MGDPKTKGMVALIPSAADATRLAVDGGLPSEELHLTLLFLGDADNWGDDDRASLIAAMRGVEGSGVIHGDGFSIAVFNPSAGEQDTCIVLGVGGEAVADVHTGVAGKAVGPVPEQHLPWAAHMSLIYTDDLSRIAEVVDRCGPITFDRLRVAFADTHTDIPLSAEAVEAKAVNPFLRKPTAGTRTPVRAERPSPRAGDDGVVTLRLYEPLDSWGEDWGVSAKEFVAVLDDLPANTREIRLLINSPGGAVWEGLAILNALRSHPARVVAVVEGIAASAASFIAAGVDELHMMQNAEMFVHCAWGGCIGNSGDMKKMAADLTHEDRNLAAIYADKSGGDVDDWLAVMCADTYYSAEEAVEAGLADKVVKPERGKEDAAEKAKARFDLSVFARAGRERTVAPRADVLARDPKYIDFEATGSPTAGTEPAAPADVVSDEPTPPGNPELPAAEPERTTPVTEPNEEDPVSDLSEFRSRLGLDDDADEAAILAALDERLNPSEPAPTTTTAPAVVAEPVPAEPVAAPAVQPAAKADNPFADELARVSAELAEIRAEKAAVVKAQVLDGAVKAGKIKPADKAGWSARYDKAPEVITEVLASIADGTEVPTSATGYTGDNESAGPDLIDVEYERLFGAEKAGA